jgi:hypothetical protein
VVDLPKLIGSGGRDRTYDKLINSLRNAVSPCFSKARHTCINN